MKKIKENHDPFKHFGSPELRQYFGSLLLNMYTVNIYHTSKIICHLTHALLQAWDFLRCSCYCS